MTDDLGKGITRMKRLNWAWRWWRTGGGVLAWAAETAPAPDSYAKVEASSLVASPQSSWARAILFSDVLEQARPVASNGWIARTTCR
jgi:hypothetical protein